MKSRQIRNSLLLVITAFIWGTAFVAQSKGGDALGPFSFNCIRNLVGSVVLLPVIKLIDKLNPENKRPKTAADKKQLWIGGLCCGTALFFAGSAQQLGMYYGTPAGKAGFLTACYILLVPILGLFLKKKCGWNIWLGMVITIVGLYLLCMTAGSLSFQTSDLIVLLCALLFAVHILVIDHFSPLVDGVRMSCIQFLVAGVFSAFPMFFLEMGHSTAGIAAWLPQLQSFDVWLAILYAGVMSSGVAYTLQIVAQNGLNPTLASMIMSLESVFSVLAGWVVLKEVLTARQLLGCLLIFVAIIFAQIPVGKKKA